MRVICTLPNASDNINGVPFEAGQHEGQPAMIAEEVDADVAANFGLIPGYIVIDPAAASDEGERRGAGRPSKEEVDAIKAEIVKLGGSIDGVTRIADLRKLQADLEKAAADKAAADKTDETPAPTE
jgi:hypothetical protein